MYGPEDGFAFDPAIVAGPATESRVTEAEAALGVRFPPSYRAFLLELGVALGATLAIFLARGTSSSSESDLFWSLTFEVFLRLTP